MTKLTDLVASYFHDNSNIPACVEDIRPHILGQGRDVFSDTLRRVMASDPRFESVKTPNRNWRRWHLVEPSKLEI